LKSEILVVDKYPFSDIIEIPYGIQGGLGTVIKQITMGIIKLLVTQTSFYISKDKVFFIVFQFDISFQKNFKRTHPLEKIQNLKLMLQKRQIVFFLS